MSRINLRKLKTERTKEQREQAVNLAKILCTFVPIIKVCGSIVNLIDDVQRKLAESD